MRVEYVGQGPPALLPPDYPEHPAKCVQPFPVIELNGEELVVPPREFSSLTTQPEPQRLACLTRRERMSLVRTAVQAEASSKTATILAVVTALAGLCVGLGVFGANVEGIIIACTVDGIAVVGVVSNAIHTGQIEPSAIATGVLALVGQVVSLVVAFALISDATAAHVLAITSSVVLAGVQVAHAIWSRNVASEPVPVQLGEVKQKPVVLAQSSIKALAAAISDREEAR